MKNIDWSTVEEAEDREKVPPGGYILGITNVEDVPIDPYTGKGDYLKLNLDIAQGKYKNYYRALYESKKFWGLNAIKSYKETALPFFKAFITSVQNSNSGFIFKNDEGALVRKLVGAVLAEEEYVTNDGEIKTKIYIAQFHSVDKINKGDFKVPELKKLKNAAASNKARASYNKPDTGFYPIDDSIEDEDLPF